MNNFEQQVITQLQKPSDELSISYDRFTRQEVASIKRLYEVHFDVNQTPQEKREQMWSQMLSLGVTRLPTKSFIAYAQKYIFV